MPFYLCPMHSEVQLGAPGKCPRCGMRLVAAGTRFALLQHLADNPLMLAVMFALMLALMSAMMLMR